MAGVKVDEGWAWLVCFGSFIGKFLQMGMVKALGILLPDLRQQFATQTWIIGLAISFVPGIGAVTCPLAGALCKRFTARHIVMIFGLLSSVGLITASFATSVPMLLFSFILTGFSMGAVAVSIAELQTYFHERYGIAISIAHSGTASGIIMIPILTQLLIDSYGWRGAMLLLGGINLHFVISGALLRPVISNHNDPMYSPPSDATSTTAAMPRTQNNSEDEEKWSMFRNLAYYLDLSLYQDSLFIGLLIFFFANGYCLNGWLIYLVPFAEDIGLPPLKAASLSSYGGLGNFVGTLSYPLVSRRFSNKQVWGFLSLCAFGALLAYPLFSTFSDNYIEMIFTSVVFGFVRGMLVPSAYQLIKQGIAADQRTNTVTWMFVSQGIGGIFSGFLSGWIYDSTGSFTFSFVVLSLVSLLTVSPLVVTEFIRKPFDYESVSSKDHTK